MLLVIKDAIAQEAVADVVDRLKALPFMDGKLTAGWHAKLVKNNEQVDHTHPDCSRLSNSVTTLLMRNAVFSVALRLRHMTPLLFSRYCKGMAYGTHVDDPLIHNLRSDVSFTLFLSDASAYDGGELVIATLGSEQACKLNKGDLIAYPSTTLHRVNAVTRGERLVAVGWCQSYVRDPNQREILWDLDVARRGMFDKENKSREFDLISKAHANLLRMWTDG